MSDAPTEQDSSGSSGAILDPEEIQALMATVNPEESAEALFSTLKPLEQPESVEPYAFLSDDEGGPQRYPLFVNLQERFGENIKDMFSDLFQRDITIIFENMQQKIYRDIVRDDRPQLFFAFEVTGSGRMLIGADLLMIISTIDAMLGGEGEALADEDEEVTCSPVELKLAERIATYLIRQLEMLWLPVQRMEYRLFKIDTDPQFLAIAGSNDACFTVEFATKWGEESSGFLEIHYPRTFLEPMMETLRATVSDEPIAEDEEWTAQIEESLNSVPVQLQLNLGHCTMTIDQFLSIKSGDYLPYTMLESDPATLCVERTPIFHAKPGEQNGMLAAELLDPIDPNV
ncbi:MAG: FliM/FliN family flagellar motor switch protein [Mariprofundales bacterium]|nr:FliM/FliN family flagellar motor switch protein [Mariprofundales bacterium]